jgi:hypothetical protein
MIRNVFAIPCSLEAKKAVYRTMVRLIHRLIRAFLYILSVDHETKETLQSNFREVLIIELETNLL